MAGFFGQALGLIVGGLGIIPRPFELLLTRFDARQHGVERLGEAADFIVVAPGGAQGVVLFPCYLPGQLFELMDRPGDQAFDLPRDDQPQQHTEDQDPEAGGQGPGVERHRQFAAGHQQQMTRCGTGAGQGDDLIAAKLGGLPRFDVPVTFRQFQVIAMLQLRQAFAPAVVQCRGT
ncbi:hypothetical protein D3C86_1535050 [compost metagenome]